MIDISKAQQIDGWMWNQDLYWLAIKASVHFDILEIGSFLGRSTRALADNTNGFVTACDIWDYDMYKNSNHDLFRLYPNAERIFIDNLKDHISSGKVTMHKGSLYDKKVPSIFDMIFIDGNHEYEFIKKDIQIAKKVVPRGLICGHDFGTEWRDVEKAVREEFGTNFGTFGSSLWFTEV